MKNFFTSAVALVLALGLHAQTITDFPYSTSFEGVSGTLNENFPTGWAWEDLNTNTIGNSNWQIIKNSEVSNSARTDSTAVHMFSNSSQSNNDWLYTPPVAMQAGYNYTLRFWYSVSAIFPSTEKLEISVGSSQNAASMSSSPIWSNLNITNTQYQEASVTYTADATEDIVFGFHSISSAVEFILLVDDVSISTNAPAAIVENDQLIFTLFPNPATELIHISSAVDITGYSVFDSFGQIMDKTNALQQNQLNLSCSSWSAGVYFIQLAFSNGEKTKKRVVVFH